MNYITILKESSRRFLVHPTLTVIPDDAMQVNVYPWKQQGNLRGYRISKGILIRSDWSSGNAFRRKVRWRITYSKESNATCNKWQKKKRRRTNNIFKRCRSVFACSRSQSIYHSLVFNNNVPIIQDLGLGLVPVLVNSNVADAVFFTSRSDVKQ